ncbi:MAG: hypothetical protein R3E01_10130 [Pirellulaceae bacterium]
MKSNLASVTPARPPSQRDNAANFFVFKDALYYPFIDVQDEAFLRTAVLYWDTLSTIVPDDFHGHRTTGVAKDLVAAKFLREEVVAPGMSEISTTADECEAFLDSPEGRALVDSTLNRPTKNEPASDWHPEAIHHQKLLHSLTDRLRRQGLIMGQQGEWMRVPGWFARYYMTVLATTISRIKGQSPLTDDALMEPVANLAMRGGSLHNSPGKISEGLLATMVLRTVQVSESTSIKKLLDFKSKYQHELGELRSALRELVKPIDGDVNVTLLQKHLSTIHTDQVLPAIDQLRGRLKDNRISCGYNNLKASTLASASPSILGTAMALGGSSPYALVAGIGVSILMSLGNFKLQRRELLRASPYSYVVLAEKTLAHRR